MMTSGALAAALVCGQPDARLESQPGPDVPGRAARLSFLSGTVSFQPGSVEDWVQATLNRPLTTGDRLWTEPDGRAEVHLGSTAMRLNGGTNFSFINLDDRTAQVQLSLGTLSVRVRRLADDEVVEIDTPQVALSLLRPGEYRVEVNEQGDTTMVSVRSGQAEATAGQAFTIHPRDQVRITAAAGGAPAFDRRDIPPSDPFDNWCADRDRREDFSQSGKYVSRDTPGYSDLDQAGRGARFPIMVRCGFPPVCSRAGRLTVSATGCGSRRGAGRGWMTRRGAMHRSIMAAGYSSAARGRGFRGPWSSRFVRFMRRRWWPGWEGRASESQSGSAEEPRSAGSRWGRVKYLFRRIAIVLRTWSESM